VKGKHKILVVDDEKNMLILLSRVLGKEGYEVVCASSAREGLEIAREQSIRLAIVDHRMSAMDGIELLRKLKELKQTLPVVVITAESSWDNEHRARTLGCEEYLSKPLDLKLLKAVVKRHITH
jgi:DNA-binding response OmpR family regulator